MFNLRTKTDQSIPLVSPLKVPTRRQILKKNELSRAVLSWNRRKGRSWNALALWCQKRFKRGRSQFRLFLILLMTSRMRSSRVKKVNSLAQSLNLTLAAICQLCLTAIIVYNTVSKSAGYLLQLERGRLTITSRC